jgi:hypothetical protein
MKDNADFYGFGSIGLRSGDKQANLNFSLDQKWALKYGTGSNETKLNDFITGAVRSEQTSIKTPNPLAVSATIWRFVPVLSSWGISQTGLSSWMASLWAIRPTQSQPKHL